PIGIVPRFDASGSAKYTRFKADSALGYALRFCRRSGGVSVASVGGNGRSEGRGVGREDRDGFASAVDVPFGVEQALASGLHQGAEQSVEVIEGLGLGGDFAGARLGL